MCCGAPGKPAVKDLPGQRGLVPLSSCSCWFKIHGNKDLLFGWIAVQTLKTCTLQPLKSRGSSVGCSHGSPWWPGQKQLLGHRNVPSVCEENLKSSGGFLGQQPPGHSPVPASSSSWSAAPLALPVWYQTPVKHLSPSSGELMWGWVSLQAMSWGAYWCWGLIRV